MELFKRKGSRAIIDNFRDIMLAVLNGKHFGVVVRTAIFVAASSLVAKSQHRAGMNGGDLQVSQCFSLAKTKKMPCGILFVDLASALASMARRIAISAAAGLGRSLA